MLNIEVNAGKCAQLRGEDDICAAGMRVIEAAPYVLLLISEESFISCFLLPQLVISVRFADGSL